MHIISYKLCKLYAKAYNFGFQNEIILKHIVMKSLDDFVKDKRKEAGLTQEEFAEKAGVALTVIRKIEQGKNDLQLEKVNHVLKMFGHVLAPVSLKLLSTTNDEKSGDLL
jgi:y4mF family transcriptional regulator